VRNRILSVAPEPGISWTETRRLGWPPRVFAGRKKGRVADTLLVKTLRWTLEALEAVRADAHAVEPTIDEEVNDPLSIAFAVLGIEPLASATGAVPSRTDIEAMRGEGRPWNAVAPVADELRRLSEGDACAARTFVSLAVGRIAIVPPSFIAELIGLSLGGHWT
jgi:hypothetical protein